MSNELEPIYRINEISEIYFPRAELIESILVSDIILRLSSKGYQVEEICHKLHALLIDGTIQAYGFLKYAFWYDESLKKTETEYKTTIPIHEWEDLCEYNSDGFGEVYFHDDDKIKYEEYRLCDWRKSRLCYYAYGYYIEDNIEYNSHERLTVEWINIQIPSSSIDDLYRTIDPKLASHSKPNIAKYIPTDEAIIAKADEMKARGMNRDSIAKKMKFEVGFESVPNTLVRELTKGLWKPGPQKNN